LVAIPQQADEVGGGQCVVDLKFHEDTHAGRCSIVCACHGGTDRTRRSACAVVVMANTSEGIGALLRGFDVPLIGAGRDTAKLNEIGIM
jgi:hypothetical protein